MEERIMYHTQECRATRMTWPAYCESNMAWLGDGYYFWYEEVDAVHWGRKSKKRRDKFEVYKSNIDCSKVLDTVFDEESYLFWKRQIEKAAKAIMKITMVKPSLKELNQYIKEKASWKDDMDGIMFADLPFSEDLLVEEYNYRKRIQLAVYKKEAIKSFEFMYDMGR